MGNNKYQFPSPSNLDLSFVNRIYKLKEKKKWYNYIFHKPLKKFLP